MDDFQQRGQEIIVAGQILYQKGLVPATSGNFSARLADGKIAITVSGKHKGKLTLEDIMVVDCEGKPLQDKQPSAEMGLHIQIYQHFSDVGAILHPHALNAVVLSRRGQKVVTLNNYEILKAFPGIKTHLATVKIPVFANNQDIPALMLEVEEYLTQAKSIVGYIITGHGFYTWGKTMGDALRHVEALDYLFACELQQLRGREN